MSGAKDHVVTAADATLVASLGRRCIVLVGMMGAGKTSVGRKLAHRLDLPFVDADVEIETAAGMTIPEIFAQYGEPYFRSGEQRVIARLLETGPQVLATGGGAYMNADTRALIRVKGVSVWLKADLDVLLKRVMRRTNRPLLKTADPAATLGNLIDQRYPIYAEADITVQSEEIAYDVMVDRILATLKPVVGRSAGAEP